MTAAAQRRAPVSRRAYVPVFLAGLALYLAVERTLAVTGNQNFVPTVLLLGALLVPVTFVVHVYARETGWTVPLPVLGLVAAVGGVVGIVLAGLLEQGISGGGLSAALQVGVVEEAVKLVVPAALLLLTRYRSTADGLIVGVTAGMGFAVLETMGYGFTVVSQDGSDLRGLDVELLARGLTSPAAHIAFTGLACAALYRAASARTRRARAWLGFAGTFVGVALLHGVWDATTNLFVYLAVGATSLGLLWRVARASRAVTDTAPTTVGRGD